MKWVALGLVALAVGLSSPAWLPYNMDEFAHYHALGCAAYPLSREGNVYRESCPAQDLRLPGTSVFLPLRSYAYIGSLPVVPFYPFWLVLSDPVAVRVQGACFFLLAVYLTARLAGAPLWAALLGSVLFPVYPFLFLDDLGPNALTILLSLGALLALRFAIREGGRWWLVGVLLFLGFFTKPIFALSLPALLVFAVGEVRSSPRRPALGGILSALLCLILPATLLLFAEDRGGHPYLAMIQKAGISSAPGSLKDVFESMGGYLLVSSRVVPRTLTLAPHYAVDALPLVLALALLVRARSLGATFAVMAVTTFLLTLGIGAASEPHHLAFTLSPLVLALAARLGECGTLLRRTAALTCLLTLLGLAVRWPSAVVEPDTGREKDRLLASLRRSGLESRTVQVHASWGTYYIAHLFGDPAQAVLYLNAGDAPDADLAAVRSFATAHGRDVLLVSQGAPTPRLAAAWGRPSRPEAFGAWSYTLFAR